MRTLIIVLALMCVACGPDENVIREMRERDVLRFQQDLTQCLSLRGTAIVRPYYDASGTWYLAECRIPGEGVANPTGDRKPGAAR